MLINTDQPIKPGTTFIKSGSRMYVHSCERNLDAGGWDISYESLADVQKHRNQVFSITYGVAGLISAGYLIILYLFCT